MRAVYETAVKYRACCYGSPNMHPHEPCSHRVQDGQAPLPLQHSSPSCILLKFLFKKPPCARDIAKPRPDRSTERNSSSISGSQNISTQVTSNYNYETCVLYVYAGTILEKADRFLGRTFNNHNCLRLLRTFLILCL